MNKDEIQKWHGTPNCKCVVCGKDMYIRPNRIKRAKHGVTCSKECSSKNRSKWFSGAGNHQFGLKEDLNSSFKGMNFQKPNEARAVSDTQEADNGNTKRISGAA